ncbi:GFA family protein [Roseibium sp.]|uniref:GFA family protein n=1 Tax=Roseibium sp. TaxID=1936156 RepID=UPI003D131D95
MSEGKTWSGGCQCGAVRFRISGELGKASICHCRMCQKAFGAFYAPLVGVRENSELTWMRGEPQRFQSSNVVARGFCGKCGTPLTYEAPDGVAIAIGAFDVPEEVVPVIQYGVEGKLAYTDHMAELPARRTEEDEETLSFLASIVSHQHPDHDTETWPPAQSGDNDNG